jgi:hypothetical protein
MLGEQGVLSREDYFQALWTYLSLSMDDALRSDTFLIRGLAMTDRRLGKRRLRDLQIGDWEHPLIQCLYQLRCEAEDIRPAIPPMADI